MAQPPSTGYNSARVRAALYYARKRRVARVKAQQAADPVGQAARDEFFTDNLEAQYLKSGGT